MLGMTGAEILTALLISTAATVLQGWLLRRSVKVRTYHTNVVHMSAFMRWLAQGMVGIALAVLALTLYKYRGVDMLAPLVMWPRACHWNKAKPAWPRRALIATAAPTKARTVHARPCRRIWNGSLDWWNNWGAMARTAFG